MASTPSFKARFYPNYVAGLMFVTSILNLTDRSILGIVTDQVKHDLALSDTQMSVVSGAAFVLFHLIAGLFISRWSDRGSRRMILTLGIAVWSLATGLTGYATGFWSLLVTRVFVGIGEATAFPIAMSLIGDYFTPAKRPRAVSIYQLSVFVGAVGGSAVSGILAKVYGWQSAFVFCGLAGLAFAVLLYATLRDPPRGQHDLASGHSVPAGSLFASFGTLLRLPGLLLLALGYGLSGVSVIVLPVWAPAFFHRSFGLNPAQIGATIGPFVGGGGFLGIILSGIAATELIKRTGRDSVGLLVPLIALPLASPCFAVFVFAHSLSLAMPAVGLGNFFLASALGPCVALAIARSPVNLRAQGSMLMLIAQAIIAGALGPYIVGALSDALMPSLGEESLRYALSIIILPPLISPLILWIAYRQIRRAGDVVPGGPAGIDDRDAGVAGKMLGTT